MRSNTGDTSWPEKLKAKLSAEAAAADEAAESEGGGNGSRLLEQWSGNTVYTYRLAEGLINECLEAVAAKASEGKVSMSSITVEQRELVELYTEAQDAWQEVALVTATADSDRAEGGTEVDQCVVINRPIAKACNEELAELLLNGAAEARRGPPAYDEAFVRRFVEAFGPEAAVYMGGPDEQATGGLCVHGAALPGAVEVAPGTRIYTGGVPAIVDAVLDGKLAPLDVRWFIGCRRSLSTADGKWVPVACARALALKQCLGLPKPLWHEVLETAGGELGELSRIELLKRPDL